MARPSPPTLRQAPTVACGASIEHHNTCWRGTTNPEFRSERVESRRAPEPGVPASSTELSHEILPSSAKSRDRA